MRALHAAANRPLPCPPPQRTKATVPLIKEARRAILLSGTPALNNPKELFQQVRLPWGSHDGAGATASVCGGGSGVRLAP